MQGLVSSPFSRLVCGCCADPGLVAWLPLGPLLPSSCQDHSDSGPSVAYEVGLWLVLLPVFRPGCAWKSPGIPPGCHAVQEPVIASVP